MSSEKRLKHKRRDRIAVVVMLAAAVAMVFVILKP